LDHRFLGVKGFTMSRTINLLVLLTIALVPTPARLADHSMPPAVGQGHNEHAVVLAMFPTLDATHEAIANGDWSDPKTWSNGVPVAGARVAIPEGISVTISRPITTDIDWIRIDGSLALAPAADTAIRVGSILVTNTGELTIGTKDRPIQTSRTASITFLPRSKTHREFDPYDVSGGLVVVGLLQIHGSDYRGFAFPSEELRAGTRAISFVQLPKGWKAGDELLFPASTSNSSDEVRTIARVDPETKRCTLSSPLGSDHLSPAGISVQIPVGNLTRNVVLASADPATIANRAHVMIMNHEGIEIVGAGFRGLGRTQTTRIHTLPERDDDGRINIGDNPIGRYAVHYHLRDGATFMKPAQLFSGNVIVDSRKHGLVNHGGHVVAENNVTFRVHGSHFFAENGSEIGTFRDNLAVHSLGSGDTIRARECLYDFGHGGHGFWTQSTAVIIEKNYAFHHADSAYSVFARPVLEFGKPIKFSRDNLTSPEVAKTAPGELVSPGMVPFRFENNMAGNCGLGLEIWNTNTYSTHNVPSEVARCQFWDTSRGGIDMPYTFNTRIKDTIVVGRVDAQIEKPGIKANAATRFLELERTTVAGFAVGVEMPTRGHNLVANCRFDNLINIRITSPEQPGRRTILRDNSFHHRSKSDIDYFLADPDYVFNGDISLLFDRDVILVEDSRFPGHTVYFSEQCSKCVPFPKSDVEQLRGKTAQHLWDEYGLAVAGALAPENVRQHSAVRGLIGPVTEEVRRGVEETAKITFAQDRASYSDASDGYVLDQNRDRVRFVKGQPGESSGWRFDTTAEGNRRRTRMVYVDATAPHFELSPCVKMQIHPDDVKYGIEICGVLHDDVAGKPTVKNMIKEFKDLQVDPDGYVTVNYTCADSVGNTTEHTYRFQVTEEAPRRGKNIGYYRQKEYTPPEEPEVKVTSGVGRYVWWISGVAAAIVICLTLWFVPRFGSLRGRRPGR
jgi:hypothetical protein